MSRGGFLLRILPHSLESLLLFQFTLRYFLTDASAEITQPPSSMKRINKMLQQSVFFPQDIIVATLDFKARCHQMNGRELGTQQYQMK